MILSGPLLVTGGRGQIGGAVARIAAARGVEAIAPARSQLDLADATALRDVVLSQKWAAIINCAAFTGVDLAEKEYEAAHAINALAPAVLAETAAKVDIPLIQVSTDYVFDGFKSAPYVESDPINPLGVYGRTKADGEAAVVAANGPHAVVRTAWVLSAGARNFLDTMLRLGSEREQLNIVDDQHGCPTSANDIAKALLHIATDLNDRQGVWHCVNGGEASWFDLAAHIFSDVQQHGYKTPVLRPITTAEYPTPAKRPVNSRLATDKLQQDFGIKMPLWQEAVSTLIADRFEQQ
jgi:dTDP-4-dehydrorhamnose reductase